MRAILLPAVALVGCSSAGGVPVNLMVMNATGRPERVATSIDDASAGEEYFRRTSLLLPGGGEELRPAAHVPVSSKLKVCASVVAYPSAHMCVPYSVGARAAECYATAFPLNGRPPYASVTCHAGAALEDE